jgi:O-antigen/teichoic acid export membrane protein
LSFLGLSAVGVFGAASRLVMIMTLLVSIVQQAWTPLSISMVAEPTRRNEFYARALRYYAAALFTLALTLTTFARELLGVLAPGEYQAGYVVVPWLAGAQVLAGSGSFTNLGMLISKRTFGNSVAAWTGAGLNVIVCLILIRYIGIRGAAVGSFLASLTFTTMLWRFSIKVADVRFETGAIACIFGLYVVAATLILILYATLANGALSVLVRTLVLVTASAATYCVTFHRSSPPTKSLTAL